MLLLKLVFWISCFMLFYNYAGYAVIVFIANKIKGRRNPPPPGSYLPSVSFIVAAYNEEDCIEEKIMNSLAQNYPSEKIEFIFVTDGSSDRTPAIVQKFALVRLLHSSHRSGKTAALNRAVEQSNGEILVFSDANTILNKDASRLIARHYANKNVGGVSGEKKVIAAASAAENAADSEGLYWKYESFLKKIDSEFYSVVGAAGELFSVRKNLYQPVAPNVILDDFIISMKIAQNGFRIIYEPGACAMELPSFSIKDEKKRKVRIAAGGFQSIAMLPQALHFWKHFRLSFLYVSHRLLRWTLSPLCLLLALLSNMLLAFLEPGSIYQVLFVLQAAFYLAALVAHTFPRMRSKLPLIKLPYYFIFMNISVYQGFFRFLRKNQSASWEKAKRANSNLLEIKP